MAANRRPDPAPLETNDALLVALGTLAWALVLVVLLVTDPAGDRGRWVRVAGAGVFLGLVGLRVVRRRRIGRIRGGRLETAPRGASRSERDHPPCSEGPPMASTTSRLADSPNRLVAMVLGAVYLLVGLLGFAYTGLSQFAGTDTDDKILGIFEVNPLHNIAHLGIGALLVMAARAGVRQARSANTLVGAVYLLLGIIGLFILDSEANILSLNSADNVLHLVSAAVLLGVSLTQEKNARTDTHI